MPLSPFQFTPAVHISIIHFYACHYIKRLSGIAFTKAASMSEFQYLSPIITKVVLLSLSLDKHSLQLKNITNCPPM